MPTSAALIGSSDMTDPASFEHRPVLLDEVVALFDTVPTGLLVDATLGGAGHACALLAARRDQHLLGIDRDPDALAAATRRLESSSTTAERFQTRRARFDDGLVALGDEETDLPIVGVLFDLGVSSPQFDRPERGFSYRADAPLDMRMDPSLPRSAADLLADADEQELTRILRVYGDERFARPIARAIIAARPVTTTGALADLVRSAIPAPARRRGGNPAKRTFQALRIAVNDELEALTRGLDAALELVDSGGRVAVISYHSGEDRIAKALLRDAIDGGCICPPGLPCVCGAVARARNVTRGGITPSAAEVEANPRAASARLRAVEVLP